MLEFQETSPKSADPAKEDDEESEEDFREQPDATMEGSSGASEIHREPERLLVTSGAESSEWIAGEDRDPDARVPDTSGSEMPNADEDELNIFDDILEDLLKERRSEVPVVCLDKRRQ